MSERRIDGLIFVCYVICYKVGIFCDLLGLVNDFSLCHLFGVGGRVMLVS